MPIYEYVCESCGHNVEVMQKMGEVLVDCPACGRPALRKRMSAPGFQLKGKGWYATDFRSPDSRKGADKGENQPNDSAKDEVKPEVGACGSGTCGCH